MAERRPTGEARYAEWVDRWSTDLYRFAHRLCGRADLAEDLVQETFYHAWRSMHTLRETDRARAWLYQILRHRWSHYVRGESRRPNATAPLDAVAERADDGPHDPLEQMVRHETLQLALNELDERYRMPLLLVFLEGRTCKEAAAALDVPLGTVLSRIHRARKHLRTVFDTMEHPNEGSNAAGDATPRLRFGEL